MYVTTYHIYLSYPRQVHQLLYQAAMTVVSPAQLNNWVLRIPGEARRRWSLLGVSASNLSPNLPPQIDCFFSLLNIFLHECISESSAVGWWYVQCSSKNISSSLWSFSGGLLILSTASISAPLSSSNVCSLTCTTEQSLVSLAKPGWGEDSCALNSKNLVAKTYLLKLLIFIRRSLWVVTPCKSHDLYVSNHIYVIQYHSYSSYPLQVYQHHHPVVMVIVLPAQLTDQAKTPRRQCSQSLSSQAPPEIALSASSMSLWPYLCACVLEKCLQYTVKLISSSFWMSVIIFAKSLCI